MQFDPTFIAACPTKGHFGHNLGRWLNVPKHVLAKSNPGVKKCFRNAVKGCTLYNQDGICWVNVDIRFSILVFLMSSEYEDLGMNISILESAS
jgi:hypothetical protein